MRRINVARQGRNRKTGCRLSRISDAVLRRLDKQKSSSINWWSSKTGILDDSLSEIIKNAFELRTESDYSDFFIVSKAEIEKQLEDAEFFVSEIEKFLKNRTEQKEQG